MGDTKNHTPKSDKTMSDGPAKDAGYIAEKNYLDGANGL